MKGKKTISLKGEEVELSFTVGAMEDFQEYLKKEGVDDELDEAINEMKHLRKMLEFLSEYAGKKVDAIEFKFLDFSEISKVIDMINSAVENVTVGNPGKAKG